MELKELTERTMSLFCVTDISQLGEALLNACSDKDKLRAFRDLVSNDLTVDWLQKIYQYYLADRAEKKQDYTPHSIATLTGMLAGDSDKIIDLCAGSGALIIKKYACNPDIHFTAVEIDEKVIPFLLFNMVIRNIRCRVFQMNALAGEEPEKAWDIKKGEEFGNLISIESAIQYSP